MTFISYCDIIYADYTREGENSVKTEVSEKEETLEKNRSTEESISQRSWIMLRRRELEVISHFLNVAQKSINNIKDVISRCQADE